jgi:hypothetical protein
MSKPSSGSSFKDLSKAYATASKLRFCGLFDFIAAMVEDESRKFSTELFKLSYNRWESLTGASKNERR